MVVAQVTKTSGCRVPDHRVAHRFGDDKPATRLNLSRAISGPRHHMDSDRSVCGTNAAAHDKGKVRTTMNTLMRTEHDDHDRYCGLRRDARAALATARGEDRTAGAGTHAEAETMRLGTTTIIGLERPLAHWRALLETTCTPWRAGQPGRSLVATDKSALLVKSLA